MSTAALSPRRGQLAQSEVAAIVGLGAVTLAAVLSPAHIDHGPVLCPFRRLTGLPCPGCGMTRSWVHAMHGQWHAAFDANPFGPVALAATLALLVAVAGRRLRKGPPPELERIVRTPLVLAIVAAWLAFSAVRLALAV